MSDQVFAACTEKTMPIAPDIAEHILVYLARFEIEAFECTRAAAPYRSADVAHADLHRETVLQEVLRRALLLRDRAVAAAPLRNIAEQLGITLDEDDLDWQGLAIEATKVLLDVSEERQRRDQGIYDGPTVYFRSAMAASKVEAPVPTYAPEVQSRTISPEEVSAHFASGQDVDFATCQSSTLSEVNAAPVSAATSPSTAANESDKVNDLIRASLQGSTFMTPNQMPTPRMSGEGPTEFNPADMGEKSYSPHFSIKTLYERILMIGVDTSMIISPFKEVSRTGIRAQEHHLRIVSGWNWKTAAQNVKAA